MSQSPPSIKSIMTSKTNKTKESAKATKRTTPCPHACAFIPNNVPAPNDAQRVLHPLKDVFVLKVAKVSAQGDRKNKLELELVSPKGPKTKAMKRIDTRETQCDQPAPCCCCCPKKCPK